MPAISEIQPYYKRFYYQVEIKKASSKILRCLFKMRYTQIPKEIHRQKENQRLRTRGALHCPFLVSQNA